MKRLVAAAPLVFVAACSAVLGIEDTTDIKGGSNGDAASPDAEAGRDGDTADGPFAEETGAEAAAPPPSCVGLAKCGTRDCCESNLVFAGTVKRSFDGMSPNDNPGYEATVYDFRLDTFEITVGRFRKFVEAGYPANLPTAGAGKNPNNADDPGWDPSWNAGMPSSPPSLVTALQCDADLATWTNSPGANENKPINCITWFEAFAFCIWDGGRLPTEAEWNYAAANGYDQRVYPWSNPPYSNTIDTSYAVYNANASAPADVGSKSPKGDSARGQSDMAGNVGEWVLDAFGTYPVPCLNCANFAVNASNQRISRGRSWFDGPQLLIVSDRAYGDAFTRLKMSGSRCARKP